MKIMVTGASGFVGSAICESLMHVGHDVLAVIRNPSEPSSLDCIDYFGDYPKTIISLDFTDYTSVESVMSKYKPDIIIHAGAQSIVRKSVETPKQTLNVNISGTVNLLEACRVSNKGLKLFYYFSTDKVYGEKDNAKEDDSYAPTCPYSASKIASEIVVKSYHETYDMPILITRSCNIYGPGDFNSRVIPNVIKEILYHKTGTTFTGDENMFRQYIYIGDLTSAVNYLINRSISVKPLLFDTYNIGGYFQNTKKQCTTEKVVEILTKYGNAQMNLVTRNDRLNEIDSQSVNTDRLQGEGWKPIVDMNIGLRTTFEWYKKNLKKIESISKA